MEVRAIIPQNIHSPSRLAVAPQKQSTGTGGSDREILCDTERATREQNTNTQNRAPRSARVDEETLYRGAHF